MSAEVSDPGSPAFRVGGALSRTFSVLFRNIVPFGILALIFNAPLQFLPQLLALLGLDSPSGAIGVTAGVGLVSLLFSFLLSATLVYGTILELRGGRAGIVECITRGFGLLLPVVGVGILVSLAIGAAVLLFTVPGMLLPPIILFTTPLGIVAAIVVAVMLSVAIPVSVIERPGIGASLRRSRELTRGNRGKVFGLYVIIFIINLVVGMAVSAVLGTGLLATGSVSVVWLTIVNLLAQAFSSVLFAVALAVVYHDLRIAKEGANVEEIAAVFE